MTSQHNAFDPKLVLPAGWGEGLVLTAKRQQEIIDQGRAAAEKVVQLAWSDLFKKK